MLTLFESSDPSLTAIIVWGKNVEVMGVVENLWRKCKFSLWVITYLRFTAYNTMFNGCVFFIVYCEPHLKRVLKVAWYRHITTHSFHTLNSGQLDATFNHGLFLKEHDH